MTRKNGPACTWSPECEDVPLLSDTPGLLQKICLFWFLSVSGNQRTVGPMSGAQPWNGLDPVLMRLNDSRSVLPSLQIFPASGKDTGKMFHEQTYYAENRDRILAKARTKSRCSCGVMVSYANRSAHRRSIAHVIWEKSQRPDAPQQNINNLSGM